MFPTLNQNKIWYFIWVDCWQTIQVKCQALFPWKSRKISQNLSSTIAMNGTFRVSYRNRTIYRVLTIKDTVWKIFLSFVPSLENSVDPDELASEEPSWSNQLIRINTFFTHMIIQGSYRQVWVKFKDFSRTSKSLFNNFQGLNVNENTGLSVKSLLQKCYTEIMETLVMENQYKILVLLLSAENSRIQGLFKAFECFSSTFQGRFNCQ